MVTNSKEKELLNGMSPFCTQLTPTNITTTHVGAEVMSIELKA